MNMILDTETTNDIDSPLAYDIGYIIFDDNGKEYKRASFVVKEIWESPLMEYAYFKDKIPAYNKEIEEGSRLLRSIFFIKRQMEEDIEAYNVKKVVAHNAIFDYRSIHNTIRYITTSRVRRFFNRKVEWLDSLKMARQTFGKSRVYGMYCKKNGYVTNYGKPRLTAEILYRYMKGNKGFTESHTGLEDCTIEKEIYFKCLKMNCRIDCRLFA